jgi:2-polyprenyl-6-methoxyphenol hydroxylase-like FAD-dependent oxidoreductase
MKDDLRVVVVGGGIGGLCLAQGLKKAGVQVSVYERDRTQWSRLQGFRIHIDPDGSAALHQCLPENLWQAFTSTCGDFSQGFTMLNERLEELMKFRQHTASQDLVARHRSVSRMTLRQVLLSGLGDAVHFDKRFDRYERHADGRIVAFFEDGSTAEGDVLVAADGVNSRVRQQYLPGNDPIDTGVIGLGGRIPLTDGVMAMLPPCLLDGPAMVLPSGPVNLFMAAWRRSSEATKKVLALHDPPEGDAAAVDEEDYVILSLGGKREHFGLSPDMVSMTPSEVKQLLRSKMRDWHPNLRKLAEMTTDELGLIRIRTSEPVAPWKPSNVTLLGDAIHSMTPYRGIGANVALRDAAFLCAKLGEAVAIGDSPVEKIGEYEAQMRDYGFAAVAESRKAMNQAVGEKKIGFRVGMSAMRIVNRVPALRNRVFEQMAGNPRRSLPQTP